MTGTQPPRHDGSPSRARRSATPFDNRRDFFEWFDEIDSSGGAAVEKSNHVTEKTWSM
ncbi:hypothetical protein [Nocardia sp. R7R-8]|uniref:hypothetical protein n=1 Tax=Nocardia sp. R7R-8 TaxID=3459304 RepID=UPI00403D7718